jgi:formylglycine-generating enzyme required for sulfatase activity
VPRERWAVGFNDWRDRNRMVRIAEGDTLPPAAAAATDMVLVAAGPFTMGAHGGEMDAAPPHRLYLPAYYIDRYEVTVADYRVCVERGACSEPYAGPLAYRLDFEARYTNWDKPDRDHYPVNAVTWYQAETYCGWAGKRLPTEAEWEKAARGADQRRYPWGDKAPDCGRIAMDDGGDGCGQESTWPVGSFPGGASPYGALDMSGNVWEWVADWYEYGYYDRSPAVDPLNDNPERRRSKVLRGGSFADQNVRIHETTNRLAYDPNMQYDYTVGFRCARDAVGLR